MCLSLYVRGGSSEKKLNIRRLKEQGSERQKREVLTLVYLEKLINKEEKRCSGFSMKMRFLLGDACWQSGTLLYRILPWRALISSRSEWIETGTCQSSGFIGNPRMILFLDSLLSKKLSHWEVQRINLLYSKNKGSWNVLFDVTWMK